MHSIYIKNGLLILVIAMLTACSTATFTDLFNNYNQQMYNVNKAQQQGDFKQAISLIPPRSQNDGSYNLSLLEKARLEFLANNNEQSRIDFEKAYALIQQAQLAAKLELSRGVDNVAAVMSNDNAIRYDIPLYEQSMLHSYQALNYIAQHNLSGALVEVRRANLVQEQAIKTHENSLTQYQEKSGNGDKYNQQYPAMDNLIGNVKNGFQNAYTFYLSALLYEAAGNSNDAYIDYKKALEIYPDNSYLQRDVWRLANRLSMSGDISLLKARLPQSITLNKAPELGQVIFIVENGIVAAQEEIAINLPIFTSQNNMRFYGVALPSYQNHLRTYSPLNINYQGKSYQSEEIVRIQSLAAKQLKDDLPVIITRQITRLVAKEKLRQQLARNNGELGSIFASLYNMATEKADTRSWSTLPDSIHILRLNLSPGEHSLMVNINNQSQKVNVTITPNKITLIKLTALGTYNQYQTYDL